MNKRLILSPFFILLLLLVGYEFYTSVKGRDLLTAAHLVEGLSVATPIKIQVAEFYNMQGEFPINNAELGLPPPESFAGRSVKSIEVSLGGKITIAYNNALKKDSSIVLTPTISAAYSGQGINWSCATETIKQSFFDDISMPCFYVPPGTLSKLMDSIVVANEAEARAAIIAGANVNGALNGDTPLLSAIARDRYAIVQQLIEAGADVNHKSLAYQKITPLIHAVGLGKEKLSVLLLDHGANIDAVDAAGKTALMHAAEKGRVSIVELLISRGANPALKDGRGRGAAGYAKRNSRRKGIDKLIEAAVLSYTAAEERREQAEGVSDLMRAASQGDVDKVRQLISEGASVNAVNNFNATALHYALESHHDAVANILIESKIAVNDADRDGYTPLSLAVKNGNAEVVRALLQSGAKVNVEDRYHYSPFLMAVRFGYKDIVALLLSAGVDESVNKALYETFISPASKESLRAVQHLILDAGLVLKPDEKSLELLLAKAVQKKSIPVVQFLLKHDVNLKADIEGLSLHVAARNGVNKIAKLLVDHGANIDAVNAEGKTALMLAVKAGHVRMVEYLLSVGANIEITDANGLTALRMAKANYAENIINLLRQHKK